MQLLTPAIAVGRERGTTRNIISLIYNKVSVLRLAADAPIFTGTHIVS